MSTSASNSNVTQFSPNTTHAPDAWSGNTPLTRHSPRLGDAQGRQSGPMFDTVSQGKVPGYCPQSCPPASHSSPPPRPNPSERDPHYSKRSDRQLAQTFLDNLGAFKGKLPWEGVTQKSVERMARQPLPNADPHMDANIKLAKELLARPGLLASLDQNRHTGATNGRFSKADIQNFIDTDTLSKPGSDKALVDMMLKHFGALKGGFWSSSIKMSEFEALAKHPLTNDPAKNTLIRLARTVMDPQRKELRDMMDNVFGSKRDGEITRKELKTLLRLLG